MTKKIKLSDGTLIYSPNKDIEEELYNAYSHKFQTGTTEGTSWISAFVDKNLDALEKNLTANPDSAVSTMREINRTITSTQTYLNKKKTFDTDLNEYLLRKRLVPWQQKVYDSTSRFISMLCGRRSGKSFTVIELALREIIRPPIGKDRPRIAIILGLGKDKTAQIYWENIKRALTDIHVTPAHIDNSKYVITLSNGNKLYILGNSDKAEREEIRGKDFSFIAIDEMQSQKGLYYLFESIIGPIITGTNGTIVCLGTAPISAGTLWEDIIGDDQYEHFHGITMEDNPYTPNREHALEEVLERNHWTRDNIVFRREYLAEVVYDTERMVYPKRTYYETIPENFKPIYCYMGLDYGGRDYTSFAPLLIDDKGYCYLWEEFKQNAIMSSDIVNKAVTWCKMIENKWGLTQDQIKIVADSSHLPISWDIYNQGITNIVSAYKLNEYYQISRVDDALTSGYLSIKQGGYFDQECDQMVWQFNDEKNCVEYKLDDKVYHGDIADSVKYAYNQYLSDIHAGGLNGEEYGQ